MAIVNPFHVKCSRELDDNSPTKNDRKEPKTIGLLVKDGRYREVYIPDDLYRGLRELVYERERLKNQLAGLSNKITRWLDIHFPEFTDALKSWRGKAAWMVLRHFSTPKRLVEAGAEGVLQV